MMDNNIYSHILHIKVWSSLTETTTDYANIENIVKDLFIQKKALKSKEKLRYFGISRPISFRI